MDFSFRPKPLDSRPTPEGVVYAKDSWAKALYDGNSIIPFADEGIVFCLLITTLLDENTNWQEFYKAVLSPQQIELLGDGMSAQHQKKGVGVTTEKHAHNFSAPKKLVDENTFQRIWLIEKERLIGLLASYVLHMSPIDAWTFIEAKAGREIALGIDKFFKNETGNKQKIDNLRVLATALKTSLKKAEAKALFAKHIQGFTVRDPGGNRTFWKLNLLPDFKKILRNELSLATNDKIPMPLEKLMEQLCSF